LGADTASTLLVPSWARVEHLEIDHRFLELEGSATRAQRDGLVETLAIVERQLENAVRDGVTGSAETTRPT